MENIITLFKIIIAISIFIVWVVRFDNIVDEFKHFGLSNIIRSLVGAAKISMSTVLIISIWFPVLAIIPSFFIAFLMLCAQYAHFRVKNSFTKFLPSFFLLCLCLTIGLYELDFFNGI